MMKDNNQKYVIHDNIANWRFIGGCTVVHGIAVSHSGAAIHEKKKWKTGFLLKNKISGTIFQKIDFLMSLTHFGNKFKIMNHF